MCLVGRSGTQEARLEKEVEAVTERCVHAHNRHDDNSALMARYAGHYH